MTATPTPVEPRTPSRNALVLVALLLAILPVLVVLVPSLYRGAGGPFYAWYRIDPQYAYLLNSLMVDCGQNPRHIDHPGTTVQEIGGLIIGAMALLRGHSPICPIEEVLSQPEIYLAGLVTIFELGIAALMFAFSLRLYALGRNLCACLAFQFSLVGSTTVAVQLDRFTPEPMMIATVLAMGLAALPLLLRSRAERPHDAILLGGLFGFGLETKLTFAPLVLLVLLFNSGKSKLKFLAAGAAVFIVAALPIINMSRKFLGWVVGLAIHSGRYGEGAVGLPPWTRMAAAARDLAWINRPAFLFSACGLAIAAWMIRRDGRASASARFLLIGFAALALQLLLTIKHTGSHYMLPAIVLASVGCGIAATALAGIGRALSVIYVAAVIALAIPPALANFRHYRSDLPAAAQADRQADEAILDIARQSCGALAFHDDHSDPASALRFGHAFAGSKFGSELLRLHPDYLFYHRQWDVFMNMDKVLGREPPKSASGKPPCTLGTARIAEGGARDFRLLAQRGAYRLYAMKP